MLVYQRVSAMVHFPQSTANDVTTWPGHLRISDRPSRSKIWWDPSETRKLRLRPVRGVGSLECEENLRGECVNANHGKVIPSFWQKECGAYDMSNQWNPSMMSRLVFSSWLECLFSSHSCFAVVLRCLCCAFNMYEGAAPSDFLSQDLVPDLPSAFVDFFDFRDAFCHLHPSGASCPDVQLCDSASAWAGGRIPVANPSAASTSAGLKSRPTNLPPTAWPPKPLLRGSLPLPPPYDFVVSPPPMINGVDLGECRSLCESFPAFFFMELNVDPSSYCECCETTDTGELAVDPRFITAATYEVVRGDPGTLQDLCSGENCVCDDINRDTQTFNLDSTQCANVCYLQDPPLLTFSIITFNGPEPYFDPRTGSNFLVSSVCICCNGPATEAYEFPEEGVAQTWTITPFPAGAQGDPHITTLDGRHYTLMKQGIFSLWHLSGLSTQFRSENGEVKTVPVDWQIYTRYSGQQAFTKGVLLVDKSGGSVRQVMEMTSQDCQWRARKADTEWTMVKDDEVISVPDSQDYVTGFQVTTKRGTKGYNRVHLSVNTRGGKMDKAVLSLSCRAHHHINLQLVMRQRPGLGTGVAFAPKPSWVAFAPKWRGMKWV